MAIDDDMRRVLAAKYGELRVRLRAERDELARVERARERLEEGRFGSCVGCGAPIDPFRIAADPCEELCGPCGALSLEGLTWAGLDDEGPYW